jgi:hypothetical protein
MLRLKSQPRRVNRPSFERIRALFAASLVSAGLLMSLAGAPAASAARVPYPIGVLGPTSGVVKGPPGPDSPGLYSLQPSAGSVTIGWSDHSTDEQKFVVYKRDQSGHWHSIHQEPTRNMAYAGGDYYYVDSDLSVSGQCYMIAAVNDVGAGYTREECTVRPDPSRFPQNVPSAERQWYGLSSTNNGTGDLQNANRSSYTSLTHDNQTWGVDLSWSEHTALWRIQAQGGPHLMHGQAVALRVWGGGWLKYGNQTWGVDLVLSSTPAYQWYVLDGQPGSPIDNGKFALWNRAANGYLVASHQTWGVSLDWHQAPAAPTATVHNASVTMTAQPPVEGYVPFLGYFGGGPGNTSVLTEVSNSSYGVPLSFIKPGHQSSECGNSNAVVALAPGATMTAAQMQTLYGSATPSLAQAVPFLACAATNASSVSVNIKYRDH